MSRRRHPALFALLALLAAVATLTACGGGDASDESASAVLDEATLQGIESGRVDLSVGLAAPGAKGGQVELSLSGPFQGEGAGRIPQADLTATAKGRYNGENVDFEGGLTLLPNSAYVNYEGTEYEVDPTTFSFVESAIEQGQREAGVEAESAGFAACQEKLGELRVGEFFADSSNKGGAEVAGVQTTEVSGELDVAGALDALLEIARSRPCRAQLAAAGPLPSEEEVERAEDEVADAVKRARATVYVGDDGIVRRLELQLRIAPENPGDGPKQLDLDIELELSEVNEEQKVDAPVNAKPIGQLFLRLGVNPLEALELLEGKGGGPGLDRLFEGLGVPGGTAGVPGVQ